MEQITLNVAGMSCEHCVNTIHDALDILPGVKNVVINLDSGTVSADIDPQQTTIETIKTAIDTSGYEVK